MDPEGPATDPRVRGSDPVPVEPEVAPAMSGITGTPKVKAMPKMPALTQSRQEYANILEDYT